MTYERDGELRGMERRRQFPNCIASILEEKEACKS